ncbi:hypothetical protein RB195_026334 [Necator americanus]|uniref:Uncharacterized protein n=1 Tax=Necator americanus TaxID=51031 RepID=A0ABR1EWG6_NECAM
MAMNIFRTNNDLNRKSTDENMWSNASFGYLRRAFHEVIVGDFRTKIETRRTAEEFHIRTYGFQWIEPGERLPDFVMATRTVHEKSQFQKPSSLRWTWELPDGGYHNETDPIILSKRFCLTNVAFVPVLYRLVQEGFSFTRRREKSAMFIKQTPRIIFYWDLIASLIGF